MRGPAGRAGRGRDRRNESQSKSERARRLPKEAVSAAETPIVRGRRAPSKPGTGHALWCGSCASRRPEPPAAAPCKRPRRRRRRQPDPLARTRAGAPRRGRVPGSTPPGARPGKGRARSGRVGHAEARQGARGGVAWRQREKSQTRPSETGSAAGRPPRLSSLVSLRAPSTPQSTDTKKTHFAAAGRDASTGRAAAERDRAAATMAGRCGKGRGRKRRRRRERVRVGMRALRPNLLILPFSQPAAAPLLRSAGQLRLSAPVTLP